MREILFEKQVSFKSHPYEWIVEHLRKHQTYFEKNMFSSRACYCHGKLMLALTSNEESEWDGLLIPTEREFHSSLILEFPELSSHSVLGKWLFLQAKAEEFEDLSLKIAERAYKNDPRIGIIPGKKKKKLISKKKVRKTQGKSNKKPSVKK